MGTINNRDAFRIDDKIYLKISAEDAENKNSDESKLGEHLAILRELNYQSNHILAGIRKNHPDISQYLALLDKKINIITRIVSMEQAGSEVKPNIAVNISSSGLAFNAKAAFTKEQNISIKMVLFPAYLTINCKARVVYCRPEGKVYRVAISYVDLDDAQSELLIRYMTEKQSEQLRLERHKQQNG